MIYKWIKYLKYLICLVTDISYFFIKFPYPFTYLKLLRVFLNSFYSKTRISLQNKENNEIDSIISACRFRQKLNFKTQKRNDAISLRLAAMFFFVRHLALINIWSILFSHFEINSLTGNPQDIQTKLATSGSGNQNKRYRFA